MALLENSFDIFPVIRSNPCALRGLHAVISCLTTVGEMCLIGQYIGYWSLSVLFIVGRGFLEMLERWSAKSVAFY